MAFPAETVTKTNIGMGSLILTFNGTNIGRVLSVDIETAPSVYEHVGGGNIQHIYDAIHTGYGSGRMKVVVDEVNAQATIEGAKTTVLLRQHKPSASSKEWTLAAATAWSKMLAIKAVRNGVPTTVELEIVPYAAADAQTWTLSNDAVTS